MTIVGVRAREITVGTREGDCAFSQA